MPGLAVVRPEIGVARPDHTHHVLMIALQELDHGFRCVSSGAWTAVARCHEDVGVVDLFAARDLHRPGVESVCYGLCAPGAGGPVVDDRLRDNASPLVITVAKLWPVRGSNPHALPGDCF